MSNHTTKVRTFLWFESGLDEALDFYSTLFEDFQVLDRNFQEGKLFTASFKIAGQEFAALCVPGAPKFNDSISISVQVDGQAEVDRLWGAITLQGEEVGCGWCRDKWGVAWQITPYQMNSYLEDADKEKREFAWEALRKMKRIVIADLGLPRNK